MANNQYVNKVQYGNTTLIDLTSDTVTADKLLSGYTAHDSSGAQITGTYSGGTQAGTVTQDADGYLVLDDDPYPGNITVESLSVTQNGTYTAPTGKAYSPVTVSVSGGGGGANTADPIRFFDYDGTLVASYSSVPSSLPSVPTHTGLTNGTWNYTLQEITTQFNAMGTCDVGANYATVSGATEIDIELKDDARLHPYLSLAVNGTVEIDWGDNSTPDTSTGTSLTTRKSDIHHEYAAAGSYTIKITKTSGTGYSLYCASYPLLNKNGNTTYANQVYSNSVQAVRVGEDCAIGNSAFSTCYSLTSVSIPSGVTSIETYAFANCYSLVSASIPSSVTSIGTNAFQACYSLESISIPSGVTSIGNSVLYNCDSLASVSIPSGVTSIGQSAFYQCYSLASVPIPSGVTSIGGSAFYNCHSLASVTIPSGVTSIGASAFYNCPSLASVTIPSGVTSIESNTFNYCSSLASVSIPDDMTSFGTYAFSGCHSLASVTIPSSVTSISGQAFSNCYGMAEYHFKPTTPPTLAYTNAFTGIPSDCVMYVPAASLTDYQTANNWSTYASRMVGE